MNFSSIRNQLPKTIALATPLALGQLGQMGMILIDTYMLGKLGAASIGGAGLASAVFYVFTLFSAGTLFGLDYLVSHAFGKKDLEECHYWLIQAVYLSLILSVPLLGLLQWISFHLDWFGFDPRIAAPAKQFLSTISWSLPPFLVFISFRQYLQAQSVVHAGTAITLGAMSLNAFLNWILIFGNAGFPAFGVSGAGMATTASRTVMAVFIVAYTFFRDEKFPIRLRRVSWRPQFSGLKRLTVIGLPAGMQLLFEAGVFSLATTLIGKLGATALASHTIVLNLSGFTYMVPFGISGATAVLVGQALGERNPEQAKLAGWTSISLGALIMSGFAVVMFTFGASIVGIFTDDPEVISLGRALLVLAGIYQIADGVQSVGSGALRGIGNTQAAMFANLFGYWGVGLPIGYLLCFVFGYGAIGFWTGLTIGLFGVAAFVLSSWIRGTSTPKPVPAMG